jgi:thiaminase
MLRTMSISTLSIPTSPVAHQSRPRLTDTLLNHNPRVFSLATTHPFLHLSGLGLLPASTLSRWLSQDRLYAQSYVSFIGALIARVHLPYAYVSNKDGSLRWRIMKLLSGCLQNIERKLEFFEDVAKRYNLRLDKPWSEEDERIGRSFEAQGATRQFESLFRAFGTDNSMTLLEGLVVLWATEVCCLTAWRFAKSQQKTRRQELWNGNGSGWGGSVSRAMSMSSRHTEEDDNERYKSDLDGGALRKEFIPDWTKSEFEGFVHEITDVTNELAVREEAWRKLDVFKAVWEHICDIERRFWPDV